MQVELTNAMNRLSALVGGQQYSLSDEEIEKHLHDAFKKFDENNNGRISREEFTQAWSHLGLSGSDTEIQDAFDAVDNDRSGYVDINEFITAITNDVTRSLSCIYLKMSKYLVSISVYQN